MISRTQAEDYLDSTLGISVPSFVLQAAVDKVGALEPEMVAAGYSDATIQLIQAMATAIVAAAGAPRRLRDQRSPSGAGRGFENAKDALTQLRNSLAGMDTAGITAEVVGPDPAANTVLLVAA